MIRKLMTACASVALMTGSALALDVTGTYTGQTNGQSIAVQLQDSDGSVHGSVHIGRSELPLVGQEQNGQIRGLWQASNGQQIPFAGQVSGGELRLATNGVTYSLTNGSSSPDGQRRRIIEQQEAVIQPGDRHVNPDRVAAEPPANEQFGTGPMTVHMEQGQIFARPLPTGWKSSESCNETYVSAPDGSMWYGFTGLEGLQQTTPAQFMQWMMTTAYKHDDFKVLQQKSVPSAENTETIEAVVTFSNNGATCKSWIRCTVLTAYGSSNGYMQIVTATPEKFDNAAPTLIQLAEKIQITDVNAAFDRARRLGVIQSIKNNPIPDTIITGYNGRQEIMNGVNARRGDVDTNTYRVTSDSGQHYYVGQEAIDPTAGGVRDPEHPERIMKFEPHWDGHQ